MFLFSQSRGRHRLMWRFTAFPHRTLGSPGNHPVLNLEDRGDMRFYRNFPWCVYVPTNTFIEQCLFKCDYFFKKGQLLERLGAGGVRTKTKNCKEWNIHGLDRTRREQSVSHHSKSLQQHRPWSCQRRCHSENQENPWVQRWYLACCATFGGHLLGSL